MEIFLVLVFGGLALLAGGGSVMYFVFRPKQERYSLAERNRKLAELDDDRQQAIEAATKPETLDTIDDLYKIRLSEIESHK